MLALGGLLVSCNDAIDIKQAGEVNNPYEVFKTPNDIKRGVSNIYILYLARRKLSLILFLLMKLLLVKVMEGRV